MSITFFKPQRNALFLSIFWILLYSFFLIPSGALNQFRLATLDSFHQLKHSYFKTAQTKKIVIVAIDDYSLKEAGEKWPWPRRRLASLIDKISAAQPQTIVLDLLLLGESDKQNDLLLAQSIKNAGNLFLPFYIQKGKIVRPLQAFAQVAKGGGFINKLRDRDFKVRNSRVVFSQRSETYYPLELCIAADYLKIPLEKIRVINSRLTFDNTPIRLEADKIIPINYSAKYTDFRIISAAELLKKGAIEKELTDKIVLIGRVSETFHDVYQTPLGIMPGIAINANNILMFINKNFGRYISSPFTFFAFLLLGIISSLLTFRFGFLKGLLTIAFVITVVFILSFFLFLKGYYLDFFSLFFLSFSIYTLTNFYKYFHLLISGERLKKLAISDEISGLFTQRYFSFKLQAEIDQKKRLSLLFLSVDNLENIPSKNHSDIFQKLALLLQKKSPAKSIFAKHGWGKFAILINKRRDEEYLSDYALKIKSAIGNLFPANKIKLVVSIGISILSPEIKSADTFIKSGLLALQRAKNSEKKIAFFDSKKDKISLVQKTHLPRSTSDLEYLAIDLKERNKELLNLLEELRKSQQKTEQTSLNAIQSLITALEEKDPYTAGHSQRVCKYSLLLADKLGFSAQSKELIRQGALLHDLGKIGIPDRILHKKGKLTPEEFEIIKAHPSNGAKILQPIAPFKKYIPIVLYHHEREDGDGYQKIKSGAIPKEAKVVAIADTFDAMTSGREYQSAISCNKALEKLKKNTNSQFETEYVEKFASVISTIAKSQKRKSK